jgi:hypothetical protein
MPSLRNALMARRADSVVVPANQPWLVWTRLDDQ